MKNLKENFYNPAFSHIYIETAAKEHAVTRQILERFPNAKPIEIGHYKDVFCRKKQNYALQHKTQNLILAIKQGRLVYPGASVCQSFGHQHFYYASCVMNCIYDCEYCYLKGMYPSGNLTIFVNLEDIFAETDALLKQHPVYLCISYDTDLPALEPMLGYVRKWEHFAAARENLLLEIRTKSANPNLFCHTPPANAIYAFTLSPQAIIDAYEHKTPPLSDRIACAAHAARQGFCVRLCFDPMLYCPDWRKHYGQMADLVCSAIAREQLLDISIGSFRVSQDYLKKMRKNAPGSLAVQYPYQNAGGVYQYPQQLRRELEQFLYQRLLGHFPKEKIFL